MRLLIALSFACKWILAHWLWNWWCAILEATSLRLTKVFLNGIVCRLHVTTVWLLWRPLNSRKVASLAWIMLYCLMVLGKLIIYCETTNFIIIACCVLHALENGVLCDWSFWWWDTQVEPGYSWMLVMHIWLNWTCSFVNEFLGLLFFISIWI